MNNTKRPMVETLESRLLMAVISVLNNNDTGNGSLRDAIAGADVGDTVSLADVAGTITLTTPLVINKDVTIEGPGVDVLSISGNDAVRVFDVWSETTASISGLTITHGYTGDQGGGIYNNGTLTLDHVAVTHNVATNAGGGVYNLRYLTMTDSSVTDNQVNGTYMATGGGIDSEVAGGGVILNRCTIANNAVLAAGDGSTGGEARGGGIYLAGNSGNTFTNCTISENSATATFGGPWSGFSIGGGIAMNDPNGLHLYSSTVVNNSAVTSNGYSDAYGGGMYYMFSAGIVQDTIIAWNTAINYADFGGDVANGGHNIVGSFGYGNGSAFVNGVNGDIVGTPANPVDPHIGLLADNGGATKTHALLDNSPAINAGSTAAVTSDQRGVARNGLPDIGAFEVGVTNLAPAFSSDPITEATSETEYLYEITAGDDDGDPITITASTDLPDWLELTDNGDGTATLAGTPLNEDAEELDVTLTVDDGTTSVDQSFTIDIVAINHAPGLAPAGTTSAVAGVAFEQTVNAVDADGDGIEISVVSKPDWLTVTDNGDGTATFAGTPGLGDGGIATVTLIANDGTVDSQPRAYAIDVAAPRWGILNGVLAIAGSSGNDSIQAWQRGDQIRVVRNGQIKNFPVAGITVVEIYGLDGNDVLALNVKSMVGYAVGGAGNDTLTGGDEIDILTGGGGKDSIMGGGGNDRLNGHNGNDRLDGGAGNDRLYGGEGNDVLFGGDGADQFFGETGDDVLLSRDTFIDHLNGGDGADSAQVDASDIKDDLLTLLA